MIALDHALVSPAWWRSFLWSMKALQPFCSRQTIALLSTIVAPVVKQTWWKRFYLRRGVRTLLSAIVAPVVKPTWGKWFCFRRRVHLPASLLTDMRRQESTVRGLALEV